MSREFGKRKKESELGELNDSWLQKVMFLFHVKTPNEWPNVTLWKTYKPT